MEGSITRTRTVKKEVRELAGAFLLSQFFTSARYVSYLAFTLVSSIAVASVSVFSELLTPQ
jgi:hypothetical protein